MANTKSKTTTRKTAVKTANGTSNGSKPQVNLSVKKTYKLYINGKFPRTESGRFTGINNSKGELIANICRGSRKDFREAVVAARNAFGGWSSRAAFNRSQIIYRIAEILEGRKAQFIEELQDLGISPAAAKKEVRAAIDRLVYYAGWADKYQQVFSSVNPVASSHFNFSVLEPTGVVSIYAPEENGLLGLVSCVIPAITGGNTCIVLASEKQPTCSISFAEVLNASDVPAGVVNILTGQKTELADHFSTHMDVNAMIYCDNDPEVLKQLQVNATQNVKRIIHQYQDNWFVDKAQGPYFISATQETKTTWHPIGQ